MVGSAAFIQGQTPFIPSHESGNTPLLRNLNAIRILVILFIGLGYSSTMPIGPDAEEILRTFGYDPSWYGIQILFFLSGWLAWRSLMQGRSIRSFILRRVRRIFPWLAFYTAIVTVILYPILCAPDAPVQLNATALALYFFKTVSLISPGTPMPGALDDAAYVCLLQGAIWTLRWGALAYFGLLFAFLLGLRSPLVLLALLLLTLIAHIALAYSPPNTSLSGLLPLAKTGLRLGYAFLLGVVVYAGQAKLPRRALPWLLLAGGFVGSAGLHYAFLPWTPMIEILATFGFCALAMAGLHGRTAIFSNWPNLVLPTYLGVWPTAQTLLYLMPEIEVGRLILMTLALSVGLAWAFTGAANLFGRRFHRRVQAA